MTLRKTSLFISLTGLAALLFGCANDRDSIGNVGNGAVFESDNPGNPSSSNHRGAAASDSSGASGNLGAATPTTQESAKDSAARAIEEADIVKIEGNRLYALSQYGGLNVIDIATRDNLRLLGRKKVQAQPFEMYVRDSIVFALYNGYGEYVEGSTAGEWSYVVTSHVIAFDTTNAADPQIIGKFAIPGTISDSRIVGNVLYVVGFESDNCWNCQSGQHTTVMSLDVTTPSQIHKVDQLSYADETSTSYSWRRSIAVNDRRMYVAGPEYGSNGPIGSTIQVVDISDPKGDLVEGTTVKASGSVMSRWQMDEYDGHLRVISQPGQWSLTEPVRIQTYKVNSSQSLIPLANVAMTIPVNETLRSVRFDGKNGYAITAEQKDPLFTIDLSNPAQPYQAGEVEIPGWIYHMEPRGNRVVALGYDQGNPEGALAISLFDVENLAKPVMLDRVNFGGNWSWISEGQDQVHKAFQVLDEAQLVLMPFSGWDYSENACSGVSHNGIQLVDWIGDDLKLRGVASMVGQPRRGLLHDSRLFAMSDERFETFDITDRSAPLRKSSLKLAHNVQSTLVAGNTIVKFAKDWYANTLSLDTTTLANVEAPEAVGHLDLAIGSNKCSWSDLGTVAASGNRVYLVVNEQRYDSTKGESTQTSRLITVDVSSPAAPRVIGEAALDFGEGWSYWYRGSLVNAGAQSVAVGDAFAMLSSKQIYDANYNYLRTDSRINILDVTNPSQPKIRTFALAGENGTTGLFASGSTVAVGRYVASPNDPARVRFYVDRLDVSDPANPELLTPVNVPGSLVAFDAEASNVATADYKDLIALGLSSEECYKNYASAWFECTTNNCGAGICHTMQQTVNLVKLGAVSASVLGRKSLEVGQTIGNIAVGKDRVFMTLGGSYGYYGDVMVKSADCMNCGMSYGWSTFTERELPLVILGGLNSDEFSLGTVNLAGGNYWNYVPMVASDDRVLLSTGWQGKLVVVDGKNPAAPVVVREAEVVGSPAHLSVAAGIGIASLYYDGVQTIRVAD